MIVGTVVTIIVESTRLWCNVVVIVAAQTMVEISEFSSNAVGLVVAGPFLWYGILRWRYFAAKREREMSYCFVLELVLNFNLKETDSSRQAGSM